MCLFLFYSSQFGLGFWHSKLKSPNYSNTSYFKCSPCRGRDKVSPISCYPPKEHPNGVYLEETQYPIMNIPQALFLCLISWFKKKAILKGGFDGLLYSLSTKI